MAWISPFNGILGLRPYKWFTPSNAVLIHHANAHTTNTPVSLVIAVPNQGSLSVINTGCRLIATMAANTTPTAVKNLCSDSALAHFWETTLLKSRCGYLLKNQLATRATAYKIPTNNRAESTCAMVKFQLSGIMGSFSI